MTTETQALQALHQELSLRLIKIEDEIHRRGLKTINNLTLIARDEYNDKMFVVVTNESRRGLKKATELALDRHKPEGRIITGGASAFEAYRARVKGVAYDGTAIPQWMELALNIKDAWEDAAYAAGEWYAPSDPLYVVVSYDEQGRKGILAVKATKDEAEMVQARWSEIVHQSDIEEWRIGDELEIQP